MSTLDIKKQTITYIVVTIITLLFSIIYECFSYGIYSMYMICSFLIPLVLGIIVPICVYKIRKKELNRISSNIYNAGVATLTFGSLFKGALDIFGTTNIKVWIYLIVGILLLIIGGILYFCEIKK